MTQAWPYAVFADPLIPVRAGPGCPGAEAS